MYQFFLYGISIFVFSFCNNTNAPASKKQTAIQQADSSVLQTKPDTLIDKVPIKTLTLSKIKIIKVLSSNRSMTSDTVSNEFIKTCKGWSLSEKEITKLFQILEPISRHEFNYQFYVLPCEMKGIIELGGQKIPFLINAGSYMKLFGSDTTLLFGCTANNCSKFFLAGKEEDNK